MYEMSNKNSGGIRCSFNIGDRREKLAMHIEKVAKELITGRGIEYFEEK